MYNLMIVDDDEVICRGLANCIDWESIGVTVSFISFNGKQALEFIRKNPIDIIIADICMPFMNGIELSYIVREEYPLTKIVLLSAFNDFKYAQKAVELGIIEYITKPFTNESLKNTIISITAKIKNERRQITLLSQIAPFIKDSYLQQLITSEILQDSIEDICNILDIPSNSRYFAVILLCLKPYLLSISNDEKNLINLEFIRTKTLSLLNPYFEKNIQNIRYSPNIFGKVAILCYSTESVQHCQDLISYTIESCLPLLSTQDDCFFSFCVGTVVEGFDAIPVSMYCANQATSLCYDYGNKSVIYSEGISSEPAIGNLAFNIMRENISTFIKGYRFSELSNQIDSLFVTIRSQNIPITKAQTFILDIFLTIYRCIENDEIYSNLARSSQKIISDIMIAYDYDSLHLLIQKIIADMSSHFDNIYKTSSLSLFNEVKNYMLQNYKKSDLTIKDAAEAIHISTSYLFYLFKKFGNTKFTTFLTNIRMEIATKLLISTNLRTYEIAEEVGYNSPQYFSICFKKHTSLTPNEYRILHIKTTH